MRHDCDGGNIDDVFKTPGWNEWDGNAEKLMPYGRRFETGSQGKSRRFKILTIVSQVVSLFDVLSAVTQNSCVPVHQSIVTRTQGFADL